MSASLDCQMLVGKDLSEAKTLATKEGFSVVVKPNYKEQSYGNSTLVVVGAKLCEKELQLVVGQFFLGEKSC